MNYLDHGIQDGVRVRNDYFLLLVVGGGDCEGLGEGGGQHAPDPVGVQLQRPPHLLDDLPRLHDDVCPRVTDDARHLHAVPACPAELHPRHYITIAWREGYRKDMFSERRPHPFLMTYP